MRRYARDLKHSWIPYHFQMRHIFYSWIYFATSPYGLCFVRIQKQAQYFSKFVNCIYWFFKLFFSLHCSLVVCHLRIEIFCVLLCWFRFPWYHYLSNHDCSNFNTQNKYVWWYRVALSAPTLYCKPLGFVHSLLPLILCFYKKYLSMYKGLFQNQMLEEP